MTERFFSSDALDRQAVRRAFDRASVAFDAAAVLHREVRQRALERLSVLRQPPDRVLDLGCGVGQAREWFAKHRPRAEVISLDSSFGMLRQHDLPLWRRVLGRSPSRLCADASALPLREHCIDWVFSNLLLPWSPVEAVFDEVRRVLKPGGVFSFTAFGPDTLRELRHAMAQANRREHIFPFADMHDLGDALMRVGFAEPVLDVERFVLTYPDLQALHRDLKAMGSVNALPERPRGLMGRAAYRRVESSYESLRVDGRLPATFEIVYGQAWQPAESARRPARSNETVIPLDALRGRRR